MTVNYAEILGYFRKQSRNGNPRITRNRILDKLKNISTHQCSNFWTHFSDNIKNIKKEKYSKVEFYFIRSGAGGVINESDLDRFKAIEARSVTPIKKEDINPTMPPDWFHPEILLTNSQIPSFPLYALKAREREYPAPFLFDRESKRSPVWVYRLTDSDEDEVERFKDSLTNHIKNLGNESEIRREVILKSIEEKQKRPVECQSLEDKCYSLEEAIADVKELRNACQIKPLLEKRPEPLTIKNLTQWMRRLNARQVSDNDKEDLKQFWEAEREKYEQVPLIRNILNQALSVLEKNNLHNNSTVASK